MGHPQPNTQTHAQTLAQTPNQGGSRAQPGYTKGQPLRVQPPPKALNPFASTSPSPQQMLDMLLMTSPTEAMTSSCVSTTSGGGAYFSASSPSPLSAPPPAIPSPLSAPPSAAPAVPSSGPPSPAGGKGSGVWAKAKATKGSGSSKKGCAKGPPSAFSSPPRNGRQFKGVRRRKWGKVVCEMRGAQGRRIWLGSFETEVEAARVYDEAARIFQGEKAWLNFPEAKAGTVKLPPEIVNTLIQHRRLAEALRKAKGPSTGPTTPSSPCSAQRNATTATAPKGIKAEEMPASAMEVEDGGLYEEGEEAEGTEGKVTPKLASAPAPAAAAVAAATGAAGVAADAGNKMGKSDSVNSYASNCSSLSNADAVDADAAFPRSLPQEQKGSQHAVLCPAAQQQEVILRAQQHLQHLQQLQQQCAHVQNAAHPPSTPAPTFTTPTNTTSPVSTVGMGVSMGMKKGGEEWDHILSSFVDPSADAWMEGTATAASSPAPSATQTPSPAPSLPPSHYAPPSPVTSHQTCDFNKGQGHGQSPVKKEACHGPVSPLGHPSPAYAPGTPDVHSHSYPHPHPHSHSHSALLPAAMVHEEEEGVVLEAFGDLPPLDLDDFLAPPMHESPPTFDAQCQGQSQGQGCNAPAMPATYHQQPSASVQPAAYPGSYQGPCQGQGAQNGQGGMNGRGVQQFQGSGVSLGQQGMTSELVAALASSPSAASLASSLANCLANSLAPHMTSHVVSPVAAPLCTGSQGHSQAPTQGPVCSHMDNHLPSHINLGSHMGGHVASHNASAGHMTAHVTHPKAQSHQGQPGALGPDTRAAAETLVAAIIASGLSALLGLPQK